MKRTTKQIKELKTVPVSVVVTPSVDVRYRKACKEQGIQFHSHPLAEFMDEFATKHEAKRKADRAAKKAAKATE